MPDTPRGSRAPWRHNRGNARGDDGGRRIHSTSTCAVEYPTTVAFPTTTNETFTDDETRALTPYFTNADRPVFALRNLPETVKGALFARYSRSAKSVRRLFLDEFLGDIRTATHAAGDLANAAVGAERADTLYARVLNEYGDDSVAQLGGAHI